VPVWAAPAIVGGVALIVAIAGRLSSANSLRYENAPLAQPPLAAEPMYHAGQRRPSMRRRSTIAYVGMALGIPFVAGTAANWNTDPLADNLFFLAIGVCLIGGCYLAGPAASFVVTPERLLIYTAFHRVSVPRHLLGEFSRSDREIWLGLTNGQHTRFRVDSPLWDMRGGEHRSNERCQVRTVERIALMLLEVPESVSQPTAMTRTLRRGVTGCVVIAALVIVPVLVVGAMSVNRS
jgi:hypothetical protein